VLLTLPPSIHDLEIYKITGINAPPLGLATIASVLENAGHKVRVIDTPTLRMNFPEWLSEVKGWRPDIIGFSMLTPAAPKGYEAAKLVKEELGNDVVVIAGGTHVTPMYEEALRNGIDVVVRGEGELTTLDLVKVLEAKGLNTSELRRVRGIAFKEDGKTIVTPTRPFIRNLDELPWPARHLLPMDKYTLFNKPIQLAHVMASRGCPYGCIYCITSYFWGRRIRFRSARNVADEVQYLVEKYGAKQVIFSDDELAVNRKFVYDFVRELKERGLEVPFSCGSRVDHVDRDYLKFLYDNGCNAIYFGVESGSQSTIDKIGKKITLDQARKVFEWVKELKGFASGAFILGFPWETISDMKRTVDFAVRLDPTYAQFTVLTPYPGTPLYNYALQHNLIEDWDWEHYTTVKPVMRGFHFTKEQAGKMLIYAYRKFYVRFGFIAREVMAGRFKSIASLITKELFSWIKEMIFR